MILCRGLCLCTGHERASGRIQSVHHGKLYHILDYYSGVLVTPYYGNRLVQLLYMHMYVTCN
jgi:hypothetical protein